MAFKHSDTERDLQTGKLTVFTSPVFEARVNPSRIFPRYETSLFFSEVERGKERNAKGLYNDVFNMLL